MNLKLKQLELDDDCYDLLQHIDSNENLFINEVKGKSYDFYKEWLIKMDNWDKCIDLPEGYTRQTIFWLYDNDVPIGIGKLRHTLNDKTRLYGGNIGYALDNRYRGKGIAKYFLSMLVEKAKELGIPEVIGTVEKYNIPANKVVISIGGKVVAENDERYSYVLY